MRSNKERIINLREQDPRFKKRLNLFAISTELLELGNIQNFVIISTILIKTLT